jgi:hypothetical protein
MNPIMALAWFFTSAFTMIILCVGLLKEELSSSGRLICIILFILAPIFWASIYSMAKHILI